MSPESRLLLGRAGAGLGFGDCRCNFSKGLIQTVQAESPINFNGPQGNLFP